MNEILAENRYVLTKELVYEGAMRLWKERIGKGVNLLLILAALLWAGLTGFTLYRGGGLLMPLLELAALAVLVLWTRVWMPRRSARRIWRGMEAAGRADSLRVTSFYADRLTVESAGSRTELAYADVGATLQSKNLLLILPRASAGILVERGSFTLGTEEEVLRLISDAEKEKENHD